MGRIGRAIAGIGLAGAMIAGITTGGPEVSAQGPKQVPDSCGGKPTCTLDSHIRVATVFPFSPYFVTWSGGQIMHSISFPKILIDNIGALLHFHPITVYFNFL